MFNALQSNACCAGKRRRHCKQAAAHTTKGKQHCSCCMCWHSPAELVTLRDLLRTSEAHTAVGCPYSSVATAVDRTYCRAASAAAMQLAPSTRPGFTSSSASAAAHQLCRSSSPIKRNLRANGLLVKEPYTSRIPTPVQTEEAVGYEKQQRDMTAGKPPVDQLFLAKVSQRLTRTENRAKGVHMVSLPCLQPPQLYC